MAKDKRGMTRLETLEMNSPEKAEKVKERLKKIKENRESGQTAGPGSPSMSWNKNKLIEYAEKLVPPLDFSPSWTKQEILDAIEEHEAA